MTDMYNNYDNETFDYYTTSTFDNRIRTYLINRYAPTADWNYGDVVSLTFNLYDCDLTPEQVEAIEGKSIIVTFYNDRYEEMPLTTTIEAVEEFTIQIDYNTSNELFKKGTYHCKLLLVQFGDENEIIDADTILSSSNCCFYVH